jgi:hypothetical protein
MPPLSSESLITPLTEVSVYISENHRRKEVGRRLAGISYQALLYGGPEGATSASIYSIRFPANERFYRVGDY